LISVSQAECLFRQHLRPWAHGVATLENPTASITTEALISDRDYPPFHRVMMDGICVSWEAFSAGLRQFKVAGICAAGAPKATLPAQDVCLEIMTGAPLPNGAALVIPYEHLKIENGIARVSLDCIRTPLENIHQQSSDCRRGETILEAGQALTGPHWGIAASFGYREIRCQQSPRIKIISTGDEIVEVGQIPLSHQIRRSNAYALKACLVQQGFANVDLDHLPDDAEMVRTHYAQNAPYYDVLLYSGGVSQGKYDYLPRVWEEKGVEKHFHGVSQRPGKPLWFGTDSRNQTTVIGLPGNPVSSLVCLHRYFIPHRKMFARLAEEIVFDKNLTFFSPVKIEFLEDGTLSASPLKTKNSGEFTGLAFSDGFVELPQEKSVFRKGESYRFFPWGPL
jgi:molybdopterin molybdotransferase